MKKIGIVGATGYTGFEIAKSLIKHKKVKISYLSAKLDTAKINLEDEFPALKGISHLVCHDFSIAKAPKNLDLIFLAVPHKIAQTLAAHFTKSKTKVIDLSADFRLKDSKVYKKWYGIAQTEPALLKQAVYGLPELYSAKIKKAKLIANPGCFPTGSILGIAPLLSKKLISGNNINICAATGTSGAGRKASLPLLFSECTNNMKAYKVLSHQHQPEIEQELSNIAGKKININFVPTLVPLERGILTTVFTQLKKNTSTSKLIHIYKAFYKNSPFVYVHEEGNFPQIKDIQHTNCCHIGIKASGKELVILTAIDNLTKGAAGQAVQNMNIMFGFPQTMGLR